MNLKLTMKVRKAMGFQQKGETAEAMKLYEEAVQEGLEDPRPILSYCVLLIRDYQFQKARELLVKIQNRPMSEDEKIQLYVNYACCVYKLGEQQKGLELLERQSEKHPCGLIYETLGYLYVDAGDAEKALSYNLKALEYDDEDSIVLDNLGQTYYRLLGDKASAREYFDKAIAQRPGQIDTLYFLAQYDIEAGDKAAAKEKLERALEGRFSPLNYATKESIQKVLNTL